AVMLASSEWNVIVAEVIGRRALPLLALLRAALAFAPAATCELELADLQGDVGLSFVLAGSDVALDHDLRALGQHVGDLLPAIAPQGAVEPHGLLVVAPAGIERGREAGVGLASLRVSDLRVLTDAHQVFEVSHCWKPFSWWS